MESATINATVIATVQPGTLQVMGNDNRILLRIEPDGTVIGDVADASEAGAVFVDAIRRLIGGFENAATVDRLVEHLAGHDWRDGDENEFGLTCRHADHSYNGGCSVCRSDLPAMIRVLLGYHETVATPV